MNKTCPKDNFSFLKIDQLVDALSRYKLLNFMDAFSNYYQIRMASKDEENTIFIINKGIYCYKIILFSLKNVGATSQRWSTRSSKT